MTNLKTTIAMLATHIAPVVTRAPKCYPFVGAKAVKVQLEASHEVRKLMWVALYHCQTETEILRRDTEEDNKRGFMSSDAWHGCRIAELLVAGKELTAEDDARVAKHATKYSKQLATMLRAHAIAEEPELLVSARHFFA